MADFPESITTEMLFDAQIELAHPENIGASPFGARSIFIVQGGTFEGPRLRGTFRSGGGDWFLSLPNGAGELDVRVTMETDDGVLIHMSYRGVLVASAEVIARVFAGEDVSTTEYYFRTTPRFETGSERYAWLNTAVCVGIGWLAPNRVGYRIFAVT